MILWFSSRTYQPKSLPCRDLDGEEDFMIRHVQNDLILSDQDVTTAESVRAVRSVGVTWCTKKQAWTVTKKKLHCRVYGLTLPDASPVDVDLQRVGRVQRLVEVQNEHVSAQSVDTGRVHGGILGNRTENTRKDYIFKRNSSLFVFLVMNINNTNSTVSKCENDFTFCLIVICWMSFPLWLISYFLPKYFFIKFLYLHNRLTGK